MVARKAQVLVIVKPVDLEAVKADLLDLGWSMPMREFVGTEGRGVLLDYEFEYTVDVDGLNPERVA